MSFAVLFLLALTAVLSIVAAGLLIYIDRESERGHERTLREKDVEEKRAEAREKLFDDEDL